MPQEINLNVAPYFDDFNAKDNYCKILFKPGLPVQARELTGIQSVLQNQIEKFGQHIFKDGSSAEFDAIILCTGYKHHFSFLPDDLRLKTANRLACNDLYKGVVWNNNPKLFYLGMQDQWYTFNMFDAQAWYVRDVLMGQIQLPDQKTMDRDPVIRQENEDALEDDYACIRYQGAYVQELINETDYENFNIDAANEAFFQWKKAKKKNIMTFRDQGGLISPMDESISPPHHTEWKDELDDTMASYLKN